MTAFKKDKDVILQLKIRLGYTKWDLQYCSWEVDDEVRYQLIYSVEYTDTVRGDQRLIINCTINRDTKNHNN